jgi:O-antigen/teichoic acid export membrane protein
VNSGHSLKVNSILNILITVIMAVYPMLLLAWGSRHLHVSDLGSLYFANGLVSYMIFIVVGGVQFYASRTIASQRRQTASLDRRLFSELFLLNLVSSASFLLIYALLVIFVPQFRAQFPVFAILGLLLFANIFAVDYLYMGHEDFRNLFVRMLISRVIPLLAAMLWVRGPKDFYVFCGVFAISGLAYNVPAFLKLRFYLGPWPDRASVLIHLRNCRPMFLFLLIGGVYANLDTIILGLLTTHEQVGFYAAGTRISRAFVALYGSIGVAAMPRLALLLSEQKIREHEALLRKIFVLLIHLSVPTVILLIVNARLLIQCLFSESFAPSIKVCQLSALAILFMGCGSFVGMQILFPRGMEKILFHMSLVATFLNLSGQFILIPIFGMNGAAVSWVLTEFGGLVFLVWSARKLGVLPKRLHHELIHPIIGSMLAGFSAYFVLLLRLPPVLALGVSLACGGISYLAYLIAVRSSFLKGLGYFGKVE